MVAGVVVVSAGRAYSFRNADRFGAGFEEGGNFGGDRTERGRRKYGGHFVEV